MTHPSNLNEVLSDEEFNILIQTSGDRLVVVDFYADWCGPCKTIAPFVENLASQYPHVSFLKVNVENLQPTAQSLKINSIPTFHFYQNNKLINVVMGGDPRKLESAMRSFGSATQPPQQKESKAVEEKSPYKYFPFRGFLYFDVTKNLPSIQKKIIDTSNSFIGTENAALALSNEEILNFKKTITTLTNTSFYHASNFNNNEFITILKLIQWPAQYSFPAFDVLRLLVLHPYAALHYAESFETGRDDSVFEICISFLLDPSLPENNVLMIWRFLANLFKEDKTRNTTILTETDQIISLAENFINIEKDAIRLSVITTLLNLAVESSKNKELSHLKPKIAKILLENIKSEDPENFYRIVLALGTLAYKDSSIMALIVPHATKFQTESTLTKLSESQKEILQLVKT